MQDESPQKDEPPSVKAWHGAPDYFRWEAPWCKATEAGLDVARDIQDDDRRKGSAFKKWFFQGWRGFASDSIRWGTTGESLIWESSGETTSSTLTRMPLLPGSAKRIDLALTLSLSSSRPQFGTQCLERTTPMTKAPLRNQTRAGQWSATDGSFCGTVGKRTAPKYHRLYDKGVESETAPPGIKWRLELEAKQGLARELWRKHSSALMEPQFCASYCVQSWRSSGFSWPLAEFTSDIELVEVPAPKPSPPVTLAAWLRRSVAPTLPRVLTAYSVAELLELLGLSDVAQPKETSDA